MNLYDIDNLITDPNQDGLYDLFAPTFKTLDSIALSQYVVTVDNLMRMDNICFNIYGDADNVDFLLDVNNIDNPLNIMQGDMLVYPAYGAIDEYHLKIVDNTNARAQLTNVNKSTKIDTNRTNYIEQNSSLPPTYVDIPAPYVSVQNNQIVIGK